MWCKIDSRKGLKNNSGKLNFLLDKLGALCIIVSERGVFWIKVGGRGLVLKIDFLDELLQIKKVNLSP